MLHASLGYWERNVGRDEDFEAVLAHIEAHLFDALSVARIAAVAELSPFHFSRLFTARMGESIMSYVRGRRLAHAAARLKGDDPPDLAELSFDCGFDSQEAFTRAFGKRFGVPPGRFKRDYVQSQFDKETRMTATNIVKPNLKLLDGLVRRDAFTVAGVSARIEAANKGAIPALWPRLFQHVPFEGQVGMLSYGVCWGMDPNEGSFNYMAALEVKHGATLPVGFERLTIPAQAYLAYRLTVSGEELHPQMQAATQEIWSHRLATSGYRSARGPDLEVYAEDFMPMKAGCVVDFYVPVEA